jgi:superfamily I DNA and RNA helicase
MVSDATSATEGVREFRVNAPGFGQQVILAEVARARNITATIPGRSRQTLVLRGTNAQVRGIVEEAAKLSMVYELKMLQALQCVLIDNHLQVPAKLASTLAMAQAKKAMSLGETPKE